MCTLHDVAIGECMGVGDLVRNQVSQFHQNFVYFLNNEAKKKRDLTFNVN